MCDGAASSEMMIFMMTSASTIPTTLTRSFLPALQEPRNTGAKALESLPSAKPKYLTQQPALELALQAHHKMKASQYITTISSFML